MDAAEIKSNLVWEWSRPELISAAADTTLEEAVSRMHKYSIHHLVVMKGERFLGMLDARDCAGNWDKNAKISEVLRSGVPIIDEHTELSKITDCFVNTRLTGLPLSRKGKIVGVITNTDLLRLLQIELNKKDPKTVIKDFFSKPIIQALSHLLGNAGI